MLETAKRTRAQLEVALLERIAKNAKAAKKAKTAPEPPRPRGRPPKPRERIEARAKHGGLRQDPKATFMKHVRIIAVDGAPHWLWGGGPKYKMYEDGTKLAQYRTPACHALRLFGAGDGPVPVRLLPPRLVAVCGVEGCIHPEHTRATGHPDLCFWPRVSRPSDAENGDGCWLWMGATDKFGYGRVHADGQHSLAHRFSYRVAFGKLDESKEVRQICGNRRCVRPEHLCLGTTRRRGRRLDAASETTT